MTEDSAARIISTIVNELVELEFGGKIRAMAVVLVKDDGDLRTLVAYNIGSKLPLIAGGAVLQRELLEQATPVRNEGVDLG